MATPDSDPPPVEGSDAQHPSKLFTPRQRASMLFVLFLVSTSSYLDRNMLGVALEPIKTEFQVSDSMLGLLSGLSFAFLYATLGIPVARWADRGDRKVIIAAALSVWSGMTVLCGLALNFWQLVLARIGVGAGEAGAMAPAQSLLADYFPPSQRARAIAFFMLSTTAGNFLALSAGGWLTQTFGWRAMFLAAGLPGLLLAPLVYFTLKEPRSGTPARTSAEAFSATVATLGRKRSYVLAVAGLALYFAVAYGPMSFVVPFMMRVHGMSVGEAGTIYGLCTALGGLIGSLLGGVVTDRLAARDVRWLCWVPAVGVLGICAFYQTAFLAPSPIVMIGLLFCGFIVSAAAYPPMYTLLHAICGSARRVMAVAVALFVANLFGIGLGPVAVGVVSDHFGRAMGAGDGLRIALIVITGALVPASLLFIAASTRVKSDLET